MSAPRATNDTPGAEQDPLIAEAADIPPAPWHSSVDALLWLHPAARAARAVLPPPLAARAGLPVTIGGLISYRDGPVGPYGEVFGAPVMLRGGLLLSHVPFMAVDSAASVAGGRGNWALPKELAEFDGDPGLPGVVTARGDGWGVRITTTARARRLPMALAMRAAQVWADGQVRTFSVTMRGRARLGCVEVEHLGTSPLGGWLVAGRHLAVLLSGRQDVSPASP
jgi:Acetoacetate decarboxylase (ADC)